MPLGKRTDFQDAKYAGAEIEFAADIAEVIPDILECGFDFAVAPLVSPQFRRAPPQALPPGALTPSFGPGEVLLLGSSQYSSQVVGKTSAWIHADSRDPVLRRDSEAQLRQELEWALHLSLQACVIPLPHSLQSANLARILNQVVTGISNMMLWLQIPMAAASTETESSMGVDGADGDELPPPHMDPWEWWSAVRTLCNHSSKLGVVLEVPESLPSPKFIERWQGEPLRALLVPTVIFLTNKRGYPTLSKAHQKLLQTFFNLGVQLVLSGEPLISDPEPRDVVPPPGHLLLSPTGVTSSVECNHPLRLYWDYLSYLFRKPPVADAAQLMEVTYRDYLQAPLQPLQDNLESQTYETFERDSTKYVAYEDAIAAALQDRPPDAEPGVAPDAGVNGGVPLPAATVVMVVGAGRGPLVRAALRASERTGRRIRVYAVEKNPNAVITLNNMVAVEGWAGLVTIVPADMRHWQAPEKAHILVSELLGSFGDNELSPECLDGAQRFLAIDGVSIPSSYTSYLCPITAAKLWSDVKAYDDLEHFETPYVVKFHRINSLAATQPVFTFEHPNDDVQIDNTRSVDLVFPREGLPAGLCHGFGGFFEAVLYGDVTLSTHPPTHTPNMFSWFPIYFPLHVPVHCPAGEPLTVHMWRCGTQHKVWYEWAMTTPQQTIIHNANGRSSYVGL